MGDASLATALALLLMSGVAMGCSVPVFRYALEHWAGDPYQAVVLHRGPLPDAGQALVRKLRDGPEDGDAARANLAVQTADSNSAPIAAMARSLETGRCTGRPVACDQSAALPTTGRPGVLRATQRGDRGRRCSTLPRAARSSGGSAKAKAPCGCCSNRVTPRRTMPRCDCLRPGWRIWSGVLELPKLDEQDIRNGLVSVPDDGLKLAFSTLRIARGDPAERAFVPMLLGTEAGLARQREPVVFPVFGQARVLYALVGKGIRHETIDRAASFLIGSCSCQVKEQNPGADLLVTADWKKLIKDQSTGVPDLPTVGEIVAAMPESVTISPRPTLAEAKGRTVAW